MQVYYDKDADLSLIKGKTVAIDLRVMSPTSYLAAPSRVITIRP